jgi:hypothetical protein
MDDKAGAHLAQQNGAADLAGKAQLWRVQPKPVSQRQLSRVGTPSTGPLV